MNTILLYRDSIIGHHLAQNLAQRGLISAIVVERSRHARLRKLRRSFSSAAWWELPLRTFDLFAIAVYSAIMNRSLHRNTDTAATPPDLLPVRAAQDVNEPAIVQWIDSFHPDVLVVYGTSILRNPLLRLPRKYVLNIHGGILPQYRNVHSDFWAMTRRDYTHLGATIVLLDAGIDTGDIALQRQIRVEHGDTIVSVKRKIAALCEDLIVQALDLAARDALPRTTQDPANSGYFRTPTLRQLLWFAVHRRYRVQLSRGSE